MHTASNKTIGRPKGTKNRRRVLPESIHPEQRLTIAEMVELSGKSRSFFHNNISLARRGKQHSSLPRMTRAGRHIVCRAGDFFAWLDGSSAMTATEGEV